MQSGQLCIDIGNSFAKLAMYVDGKIDAYERYPDLSITQLDGLRERYDYNKAIISSTRHLDRRVINAIHKKYDLLELDHNTPIPIENLYATPATLGRDRLAAVIGAQAQYPGKDIAVIDLGTCNTFDIINSKKQFLGGNIGPGVDMKLKAMHHFTDKLPLPKRVFLDNPIGKDTTSALQNGAFWGTIFEIESFIERMKAQFPDLIVILTGGDAQIFGEKLKSKIFVAPNLVLDGLHEILKYNAK